jgi:hypothetical protein
VYLGLGEMEEADDAFSDAVAVGGKSAAGRVDETVMTQYQKSVERIYPPEDRSDERALGTAFEGLTLLTSEKSKEKAMRWTLDFLDDQDVKDKGMYDAVSQVFGRKLGLDEEAVEAAFLPAIERLMKQAKGNEDNDDFLDAAGNLAYRIDSEDGKERLEKIVKRYMPNIGEAKRTMADIRTLGTSMEAFAVDNSHYPEGDLETIVPLVQPTYVKTAPTTDGWGTRFKVISERTGYVIISAGADETFDKDYWSLQHGANNGGVGNFDYDIVYSNGSFDQYPMDVQRN